MPLETRLREHLRAEFDLVPARSGRVVVGQPATTRQIRRRPRGPVLAGGVALLVVVVGLSGPILLAGDGATPPDTNGASTAIDSTVRDRLDASTAIEWTVWDTSAEALVASGPGGFVRAASSSPGRARVEFSVDGRTWETTTFDPAPPVKIARLIATPDMWMLSSDESNGSLNAYLSADGRNWARAEWPAQLEGVVTDTKASELGFLALSRSGSEVEMWTSDTGVEWEPWDELEVENENSVLGGPGGWVALGDWGAKTQTIFVSNDGQTWSSGELAIPSESAPSDDHWISVVNAGRVGETWIAVGSIVSASAPPALQTWTSADGSSWQWQGSPAFGTNPAFALSGTVAFEDELVLVAPALIPTESSDGWTTGSGMPSPTGQIFVSDDGLVWEVMAAPDILVHDIAVRTLEGGARTGVVVGFALSQSE